MNPEEIKARHQVGFSTLFKGYPYRKLKKGVLISLMTSTLFVFLIIVFGCDARSIILVMIQDAIAIMPNLIGFVLAGYAIIVGFGNKEFLLSASEPGKNGLSLYQTYSYIYSFSLITLIATLFCAFVFRLISLVCYSPASVCLVKFLNISGLFILVFLIIQSLASLLYMVINVFNLAQAHHLKLTIERLMAEQDEKK